MASKYELEEEDAAILGQCLDWLSMMAEMQIDDTSRNGVIAVIKLMAIRFGIPFEEVEETQLEDGSFHVEVHTVTDEEDSSTNNDEDEDPVVH